MLTSILSLLLSTPSVFPVEHPPISEVVAIMGDKGDRGELGENLFSHSLHSRYTQHPTPNTLTKPVVQLAQESDTAKRAEAERLDQEALELYQQGTGESLQQAREKFSGALVIWRELGEKSDEALNLILIGNISYLLGQPQLAIEYYEQALVINREVGDRSGEGATLNNLGLVYNNLGQPQLAIEYYEQALVIRREVEDRSGEGVTLNNLGAVYRNLGQPQKAILYYEQALVIIREVEDRRGEGVTLNNLGLVYNNLGQPQLAIEYYEQALVIRREVEDRSGEGNTLNNLGLVYDNLGQPQKAILYYEQALVIIREVEDRRGEGVTLNNLGLVYDNLGQPQKAIEYYEQALVIIREVGNRSGEGNTLYNTAILQRQQGNLTDAKTNIEAAITIVEDIRTQIINPDLRTDYFATVNDYYKFYIDLLMELHQQQPQSGYDILAFNASERARARTLLELLNESNADIKAGVDPQLLEAEQNLLQQIKLLQKQRYDLFSTPSDTFEADLAEFEAKQQQIFDDLNSVQTQIRATSPRYANLTQPQPLELKQVQTQVLDSETILLQYSLGEARSYLWVVTTEGLTSYTLPPQSEIATLVTQFQETRSQYQLNDSSTVLTQLTQQLLPEEVIKGKRLLIVRDGILQTLPYNLLLLESGEYLSTQIELIYSPSASTIDFLRRYAVSEETAPHSLIIFADPVFSVNDPRLESITVADSSNDDFQLEAINRSLNRSGWDRIPYTREEAEAIVNLYPESQRVYFYDFDSDLTNLTQTQLNQYQIVHLATHGVFNGKQPALSGIILSLVGEDGEEKPGLLSFGDIFNLNLDKTELVILSACKTGVGEQVSGEGVVGITRGFMYAGAEKLLVSLWDVNDGSTAELMKRFYQYYQQEGLSVAQALQKAQLEVSQIPGWEHPYYWGAFIVMGEWE